MQGKARKDQKVPEPNVVEIFKDCHTSKKKGMTTPVKAAVVRFLILMPFNYYLLLFVPWTAWFAANIYYSFKFYTQLS